MADGINSIDDLKVVITAETEKLSQGLTNANALIGRFAGDADGKLKSVDGAIARIGAGVLTMRGHLVVALEAAQVGIAILEKMAEKGDLVFEKLGAGSEWGNVKTSFVDIFAAVTDLVSGIDSATRSASYLSRESKFLGNALAETKEQTDDFVTGGLNAVSEAMERAAHEARRLTSREVWSSHTVAAEIERTKRLIDSLGERIKNFDEQTVLGKGFAKWLDMWTLGFAQQSVSVDKLVEKLKELKDLLPELESLQVKQRWKDTETDSETAKFIKGLDAEVEGLRLKAATLNMATAEAAAYVAMEKIKTEAARTGAKIDMDLVRERIAQMRTLRQTIDDHADAKRKAQEAERAADRQEKGESSILHGAERELHTIRRKTEALGGVTAASKAAEVEERLLEQARGRNIVVTDALAMQIKAYAYEIGKAEELMRNHQRTVDNVNQVMAVGFRAAETAFDRYTSGAKMKGKEMVESLIRDIERLIFKLLILKPLQEAIGGSISGGISQVFGGPRAEGGPVSRGTPYLVGERGPELMVPDSYGSIIPNHALRAGGSQGGGTNVVVNITAPAGTSAKETRRRDEGGNMTLDILIEQMEGAMAQRVGDGTSPLGGAIESRFGLSSAAGAH